MEDRHKCPVCGEYEFERHNSFDMCPVCGWTDDAVQEKDPDRGGCANGMSLNEARKAHEAGEDVY